MKKNLLSFFAGIVLAINMGDAQAQIQVTADANGVLYSHTKLVAQTTSGQVFFTGHQLGTTYANPGNGIFRAMTDNVNGSQNHFYDGLTNGVTKYSVRADGQGYFAGRLGVGTASPAAQLDINGGTTTTSIGNVSSTLSVRVNTANAAISLGIGYVSSDNPMIQSFNNANNSPRSLIMNPFGGNIGIGTLTPDALLTVNGSIHAREIKIDLNIPAPDYVFDEKFKLRSLAEVWVYIAAHKHLPEIPSAKEMEQNGVNVSELNMKLLQKVEELTLYLIEKDKTEQEQKEINEKQSAELKQQKEESTKRAHLQEERIRNLEERLNQLVNSKN
jgi:hypothetical protein